MVVNLIFLAILFFEGSVKAIGYKYFRKCAEKSFKLQKHIEKQRITCDDYYIELNLHSLLDDYKKTSIEIEKYNKHEKEYRYPEDQENIQKLLKYFEKKMITVKKQITDYYILLKVEVEKIDREEKGLEVDTPKLRE